MGLTIRTLERVDSVESSTEGDATAQDRYSVSHQVAWVDGTGGAHRASKQWNDTIVLTGTVQTVDLAGGLTTRINTSPSFSTVRLYEVTTGTTNTGTMTLGGGSNPWGTAFGTLNLGPGQSVRGRADLVNGWPVTAGTGDTLQLSGTIGDRVQIFLAGE